MADDREHFILEILDAMFALPIQFSAEELADIASNYMYQTSGDNLVFHAVPASEEHYTLPICERHWCDEHGAEVGYWSDAFEACDAQQLKRYQAIHHGFRTISPLLGASLPAFLCSTDIHYATDRHVSTTDRFAFCLTYVLYMLCSSDSDSVGLRCLERFAMGIEAEAYNSVPCLPRELCAMFAEYARMDLYDIKLYLLNYWQANPEMAPSPAVGLPDNITEHTVVSFPWDRFSVGGNHLEPEQDSDSESD